MTYRYPKHWRTKILFFARGELEYDIVALASWGRLRKINRWRLRLPSWPEIDVVRVQVRSYLQRYRR